ncbi:ATP-binding protein [Streptomyces sp. NPDC093595]|uniref:ATP-binding protein n=1 Tax=Streptomyces sp. NPDC093595 TaxID=3366045 RepID=UPI00381994CC
MPACPQETRPPAGEPHFSGRRDELARLRADLAAAHAGGRLVVVEGPPGIGKTALVRRFLRQSAPARTLTASGDESEAALAYGVLLQLLRQTPAGGPAAGDGALDHGHGPRGGQPDPYAAGTRLLDALTRYARAAGPVVVVVDDAHWADPPSLRALTFALRRLRGERVLTVLAVRDAADPRLPEGLRRLIADEETSRVTLHGLGARELCELSEAFLPGRLPLPSARRLRDHTDGNPEHVRALLRQVPPEDLADPDTPLPAPRSYALPVLADLERCDAPTRAFVVAAGVLGTACPVTLAARLAGTSDPLAAVEQAVRRGLLREHAAAGTPTVVFPHPLVRAAVYHSLGAARRTALHAAAARLVDDAVAAVHHKLRAAPGTDGMLARELAAHAQGEADAGRWSRAASLLHQAARLSDTAAQRARLGTDAIDALIQDGRADEAATLAGTLPGEPEAVRHRYARGHLALVQGDAEDARVLLHHAWNQCDAQAEPPLARRIAEQLASASLAWGRPDAAVRWAGQALALPAAPIGTGMLRFVRLTALGAQGAVEAALAEVAWLPEASLVDRSHADLLLGRGMLRLWSDAPEAGRHDLRAAARFCSHGPAPLQVLSTALLGWAEFRLGRWATALDHLEAACARAADTGQTWLEPAVRARAATVRALRGDHTGAAEHLRVASRGHGSGEAVRVHLARARACLALASGAPHAAVAALAPLLDAEAPGGAAVHPWRHLLADALTGLGEYDRADRVLTPLEQAAADHARPTVLASAARARGNLLGARRHTEAAERSFTAALAAVSAGPHPYERARVELDYGAFLRRTGRRSAAARHLSAAHDLLTALGSVPYLHHCERELSACGRPVAAPPRAVPLTSQEFTVARLATTGYTNRQIAHELVLSVKTVEYHLSNIYAKLGISSRMALMGRLEAPPVPPARPRPVCGTRPPVAAERGPSPGPAPTGG